MQDYTPRKLIIAILDPTVGDDWKLSSSKVVYYEFKDEKKYWKYLTSDCISRISEECDAWFIDDYEEQDIHADKLPIAINILDEEIKKKKNAYFVDYLIKTKELMELALKANAYFEFMF